MKRTPKIAGHERQTQGRMLEYLGQVARSGESLIVTDRGTPVPGPAPRFIIRLRA